MQGDKEETADIWRNSPLRYAGYCNEVGEAFAPLYPRLLIPSYVASVLYVLGDTTDKSYMEFENQKKNNKEASYAAVAMKAGDVLLWQMLASVIIPGLTIKGVAKSAQALCAHPTALNKFSPGLLRYAPTVIGLVAIPFIIKPIDMIVDEVMDVTYRKIFSK